MTFPRGRGTTVLLTLIAIPLTIPSSPVAAAPSREELEAAQARLLEIEKDFELVVEEYNLVAEELEGIQTDMAAKRLVVRDLQDRMDTKRSAAVALAVELYKAGPRSAMAVVTVLSSESFAELDTRLQYLTRSNEAQAQVFERLAADRVVLDDELAELEEAQADALAAQLRLEELRASVEDKLESQRDEIAELNEAIALAQARREQRARRATERAIASGVFAVTGVEPNPAPAPNPGAQAAVDAALSQMGKPYRWGAEGPDSYDCSGLTMWAWAKAGVSLPHNSGAQYEGTKRVPRGDWQPGDLLFFGSPIHHVSMYIGNGQMVEAPYSGSQVRVVDASRTDYVGAGRPGV